MHTGDDALKRQGQPLWFKIVMMMRRRRVQDGNDDEKEAVGYK